MKVKLIYEYDEVDPAEIKKRLISIVDLLAKQAAYRGKRPANDNVPANSGKGE